MTFFFAWVGGDPLPAVTLSTKGDVWGGSLTVLGSVWGGEMSTSGDLLPGSVFEDKAKHLINLRSVDGLVSGNAYFLTTTGTSGETETTFTFDGVAGGDVSPSVEPQEGASVKLTSDFGRNQVTLEDTSQLLVGRTYNITGQGIPDGTTFDFEGDEVIFLSSNATHSGARVELTITSDVGRNTITNLLSASGLVVGEIYQVFGRGLGPSALGTYEGGGVITLSERATLSALQTTIRVHRGVIYPDGGAFDAVVHARQDEQVLSLTIDHAEGNFALLSIELKNPRVGMLSPGRNVWCWLSWQETPTSPVQPLFHGRLLATPAGSRGERVTIQFLARPGDYESQQALVMAALRVPPYWDPPFLSNGADDATSILEARTEDWHIDRVTLQVTTSDLVSGEDGTVNVGEDQDVGSRHIYDSLQIKYGNPPLAAVYVTASVTWTQQASGDIDITDKVVAAFKEGGSTYGTPNVSSYAGDGLLSSWPKPLTTIGGGWSVGLDTTIVDVTSIHKPKNLESRFTTAYPPVGVGAGIYVSHSWDNWATLFPLEVYAINFQATYAAKREWTESVSFFLEAEIQQIHTDSRASVESFSLSSNLLQAAVDPDGLHPLRDDRYNSYFKTARGQDSFRFLLAYAKAKLVSRARAVDVIFVVPWKKGLEFSCRKNVFLVDARLPGGSVTGKVKSYKLQAGAVMRAEVTIGCTIGLGGSVEAADGDGSYASSGYMQSGYQTVVGGTVDLGDNTITYQNFDDFEVRDDGIDFFSLNADSAVKRCVVSGGVSAQRSAISMTHKAVQKGSLTSPPDPVGALKNCYTVVVLEMNPVQGGAFLSEFAVDVSRLQVPKTIDLRAT